MTSIIYENFDSSNDSSNVNTDIEKTNIFENLIANEEGDVELTEDQEKAVKALEANMKDEENYEEYQPNRKITQ